MVQQGNRSVSGVTDNKVLSIVPAAAYGSLACLTMKWGDKPQFALLQASVPRKAAALSPAAVV